MNYSQRIIFMGTPELAVPYLKSLLDSNYNIVAVYTQPPRPRDRGMEVKPSPIQAIAEINKIPFFTPSSLNNVEEIKRLEYLRSDLVVVMGYGILLPKDFFEKPTFGCINVHLSLLPKWRGASPVEHSLLNGENETGVTIFKLTNKLDSGPILGMEEFSISPEVNTGELEDALAKLGADLFLRLLHPYVSGTLVPAPQNESMATSAPAILKADSSVNWEWSSTRIHNLVRAFNPKPGARTILRGNLIKLWKTRIVSEVHTDQHLPIGT